MPSKNTIKSYTESGIYHIYNRGVEKRRIFEDREDYQVFLKYLEVYLSPVSYLTSQKPLPKANLLKGNLAQELELICFCLMPNHFHLLFKQKARDSITKFMRQISTAYSMYFNKRYNRVGPLFQGIYKAVSIVGDDQLLYLSRYIHRNPLERGANLRDFQWSSYTYYILGNPPVWLNTKDILGYFSQINKNGGYEDFVETATDKLDSNVNIDSLILET